MSKRAVLEFITDLPGQIEGNTCYLNALLQVLARIRLLRVWVFEHYRVWHAVHAELSCPICCLATDLHCIYEGGATETPYTPTIVATRHLWSNGFFNNRLQQDVTEAMNMLFMTLHDVEARGLPGDISSPMWELLEVAGEQCLMCETCGCCSSTTSRNISIALELHSGQNSVAELLVEYWGEQIQKEGDDPYRCPAQVPCPAGASVRKFEMPISWPPVLVISFKRWTYTNQILRKLNNPVEFDVDLSVENGAAHYRLCGLIQHLGVAGGGHYIAYVRDTQHQWLLCDDAVSPRVVSLQTLLQAQPYVMVYERTLP